MLPTNHDDAESPTSAAGLSRDCLLSAGAEKRAAIWLQENLIAIESSNAYVDEHGLPLERLRRF